MSIIKSLLPESFKRGYPYIANTIAIYNFKKMTKKEQNEYIYLKFKDIVIKSYENSEFYRDFYDSHRFEPYKIKSKDDFKHIPILEKKHIKGMERSVVLTGKNLDRLVKNSTSGTSGNPLTLYRYSSESAIEYSYLDYYLRMNGINTNLPYRKIIIKNRLECGSLFKLSGYYLLVSISCLTSGDICELIKVLRKFDAKFIHGYASAIMKFFSFLDVNDVALPSVKVIFSSSETLTLPQKNILGDFFASANIIDWYGNSERNLLGVAINLNGFAFDSHYAYTEVVGNSIISTKLISSPMPLIRYKTDDIPLHTENGLFIAGRVQEGLIGFDYTPISMVGLISPVFHDFYQYVMDFCFFQPYPGLAVLEYTSQKPLSSCVIDDIRLNVNISTLKNLELEFKHVDSVRITSSGKKKLITKGF